MGLLTQPKKPTNLQFVGSSQGITLNTVGRSLILLELKNGEDENGRVEASRLV